MHSTGLMLAVLLFPLLFLGFLIVSARSPKGAGKLLLVLFIFIAFSVVINLLSSIPTPKLALRVITPENFEKQRFFVVVQDISSGKLNDKAYRDFEENKESLDVPETGKDTFKKVILKPAGYEVEYSVVHYKAGRYGHASGHAKKFSSEKAFEYKAWRDENDVLEVQLGNKYLISRYAVKNGKLIRVLVRR